VHLSELNNDGGGRPWGHREVESEKGATGEVGNADEAESMEVAAGNSEGEGRGTSMSSTTLVEARGGYSGAAGHGGVGKHYRGRGHQRCQRCREANSEKGGAGEVCDAEK
jgi:hypothetical protein